MSPAFENKMINKRHLFFAILLVIVSVSLAFASQDEVVQLEAKDKNSPFTFPILELKGRVAEIFTFYDAEYISGMTCRIKYNGIKPLPSNVFFSEYDNESKEISHKVKLIYPELKAGESGYATFRINGHPSKLVIWSEGEGPWESPC
jgi:hypothetical protein